MSDKFDVVVIGGGPGGYVAAIRAAQLGLKTACIESRGALGGTCLNEGCIPSKALLDSSEKYHDMKEKAVNHGISFSNLKLDLKKMMSRKNKVITDLNKGIEGLFKKNKIKYFEGLGSFESNNKIKITKGKSVQTIETKSTIIATGSSIMSVPGIDIDEQRIVSSTGVLSLSSVPKKMIVIGGGYIGLEMGSVWSRLGSEVTVIEYADKIVPSVDNEIGKQFQKILGAQGLNFRLQTKVLSATLNKEDVTLEIEELLSGNKTKVNADVVLVAVGRKPNTVGLGLENVNVKTDQRGVIEVNENFNTSAKNIFAIGDVIKGPMLAHKAEEEGVAVAEIIAGQSGHVNYEVIPSVIYTWPEVASVGMTEEEVKVAGISYLTGKFPFLGNSRARVTGETDGMVKVISRKDNDEILGIHIIGPHAGNMIAEAVMAMEYKASSEDIARTCHAHPTLSESVKEACLDVLKVAIHK